MGTDSEDFGATPASEGGGSTNELVCTHEKPLWVWACGINAPARCQDADVRRDPDDDPTAAEPGWDVGFEFKDFNHLVKQLCGGGEFELPSYARGEGQGPSIDFDQLKGLGILAHGGPGGVDINGLYDAEGAETTVATDSNCLNMTTVYQYDYIWSTLANFIAPGGKLIFYSCLTAQGEAGRDLVRVISDRLIYKHIKVVAFTSILYVDSVAQKNGTGSCYPSARETTYSHGKMKGVNTIRYYEKPEYWKDLDKLPWASSVTPHATVAQSCTILREGKEPSDYDPYLPSGYVGP